MRKRSIAINGHRTSIALEPEFWDALAQLAAQTHKTMPQLIADIDAVRVRDHVNLASALRVAVLQNLG